MYYLNLALFENFSKILNISKETLKHYFLEFICTLTTFIRSPEAQHAMFMAASPSVNFTSILHASYFTWKWLAQLLWASYNFGLYFFRQKVINAKAACKMLMKLTTAVIERGRFCMIAMEAARSLAKDQNSNV
jgi:hypothetical protein